MKRKPGGYNSFIFFIILSIAFLALSCNSDDTSNSGGSNGGGNEVTPGVDEIGIISVDDDGNEGDDDSQNPSISSNGKIVAFESFATNLVQDNVNVFSDIYVHDINTGLTERITDGFDGPSDGDSKAPSMSSGGRFVAFESTATNLVLTVTDDNGVISDIFLHDQAGAGLTTIISLDRDGEGANGDSESPSINSDGTFIAFQSRATDLVSIISDGNGSTPDIFLYNVINDATTIISLDTSSRGANGASTSPSVDRDGDMIAFESTATDIDPLTSGDNGSIPDIFIHDRSGPGDPTNTIISIDTNGEGADGASANPSISADGRFVAFQSVATDLVADVPFENGGISDIFVHDLLTGITEIITLDTNGEGTNNNSTDPSISSDGRFVAYRSFASDLVANDTNDQADIFVHDRQENATVRINVNRSGNQASGGTSDSPTISINGGFVAFDSLAVNLISIIDTNGSFDVFVTPNSLIQ